MRLMKEHSTYLVGHEIQVWNGGYFNDIVTALVEARDGVRRQFVDNYVKEYQDIAVYTVLRLAYVLYTGLHVFYVVSLTRGLQELRVQQSVPGEFGQYRQHPLSTGKPSTS